MVQDVTRHIARSVERELWARTAGRCQFDGCNRILYKSPVTQESVNISEKAHIYSFSQNGPRGWGLFRTNKKALNDVGNLMLVCHDCHKKIDKENDGGAYQADLRQLVLFWQQLARQCPQYFPIAENSGGKHFVCAVQLFYAELLVFLCWSVCTLQAGN